MTQNPNSPAYPTQVHQYAEQFNPPLSQYPSVPQQPPAPVIQGRAIELVSPFRTGVLVGLGFIVAAIIPFAVLVLIGIAAASGNSSGGY